MEVASLGKIEHDETVAVGSWSSGGNREVVSVRLTVQQAVLHSVVCGLPYLVILDVC